MLAEIARELLVDYLKVFLIKSSFLSSKKANFSCFFKGSSQHTPEESSSRDDSLFFFHVFCGAVRTHPRGEFLYTGQPRIFWRFK